MVTATLPPYAQPGSTLDASVAAIGDASNLQGGLLVLTTLRGINGQVYASVQGPVVTAGFVAGRAANSSTVNHPTAGRIPNGASVERLAPSVPLGSVIKLQLREADFTTSARISEAVNHRFGAKDAIAHADNSGLVSVNVPHEYAAQPTEFVAELERLVVEPDRAARVVINEKTGTVVLGSQVRIAPVAIMQLNRRDRDQADSGTERTVLFGTGRGCAGDHRHRERRQVAQRIAEGGSNGGRIGQSLSFDWLYRARCHRHSRESAGGGRARRRAGCHLGQTHERY
jgi:flagellar basal body P-ring protein FlgI